MAADLSNQDVQGIFDRNPVSPYDLQDPYLRQAYAHSVMRDRNRSLRENPSISPYIQGIVGAATGAGLGHLGGKGLKGILKSIVKPELYSEEIMKHAPRAGTFLGGAMGASSGALNKHKEIELANKMRDPQNISNYLDQVGASENYF